MFVARLAATRQTYLHASSSPLAPRAFFSTSAVAEAGYKMKSHSGAKKRWRSLGSGDAFKRGRPNHSHLNVHKSATRKNRLSQTGYSNHTQTVCLKKRLLPYGSG